MTFLMIARILYDKGYAEYVETARRIKIQYHDVEFQLLGNLDMEHPNGVPEEIVRRDHSLGIINYLGYIPDVAPVIMRADCIVHPSFYYEGLSRVLMEGLAMGKPIITTTVPGCIETVDDNENGYLVPPKDIDALANAVERFLSMTPEERTRMGAYSRMKAEKEFDVRHVIAQYKRITDEFGL